MRPLIVLLLLGALTLGVVFAQEEAKEDEAAAPETAGNNKELIEKLKQAYARKMAQEAAGKKTADEPLSDAEIEEIMKQTAQNPAAPPVRINYLFPEFPNRQYQAGKVVEMVAGLTNLSPNYLLVTSLYVCLYHPQDYRFFIQNFTRRTMEVPVAPGEEVSFQYMFMPDPSLDPHFYRMLSMFEFRDDHRNFSALVFNETVDITEAAWNFDWKTTGKTLAIGAILLAGCYFGFMYLAKPSTKSSSKTTKKPAKKPSDDDSDSWLHGTSAAPKRTKPKARSPPAAQ